MSTTTRPRSGPFGPTRAVPRAKQSSPEPNGDQPAGESTRDPGSAATPRILPTVAEVGPMLALVPGDKLARIRQDVDLRQVRTRTLGHALRYRKAARRERAISNEHKDKAAIQDVEAALDKVNVPKTSHPLGSTVRMLTLSERIEKLPLQILKAEDEMHRMSQRHQESDTRWSNTVQRLTAELETARAESGGTAIRAQLKRMGSPELDRAGTPLPDLIEKVVDRLLKAEGQARKLQEAQQSRIGAGGPYSDGTGLG